MTSIHSPTVVPRVCRYCPRALRRRARETIPEFRARDYCSRKRHAVEFRGRKELDAQIDAQIDVLKRTVVRVSADGVLVALCPAIRLLSGDGVVYLDVDGPKCQLTVELETLPPEKAAWPEPERLALLGRPAPALPRARGSTPRAGKRVAPRKGREPSA